MPHRRTFAAGVLPFAHSDAAYAPPSWLRLAAYAGSWGMGSPAPIVVARERFVREAQAFAARITRPWRRA